MKKEIFIMVIVVLITSLACSWSVKLPQVETSDDVSLQVAEDVPTGSANGELVILMGGGKLSIDPGEQLWVSGNIDYNVPLWTPIVKRDNSKLEISQETKGSLGVPSDKIKNNWQLMIGNYPTDLTIKAGAYQGVLNLGGIPLKSVDITDGASKSDIIFDQLNAEVMKSFSYKTGASQINIENLGNANAENFSFDGGAGSYTFDFSGELQRSMDIKMNYGLGDMKIIIPKGVPATITVDGGLNNVNFSGTWNVSDNVYHVTGSGPELTFNIKMGLGNLQLISR